ncbi:hypothetical protein ADUPG1_004587, partial [Aduncisulcus paluster]
FDKRAPLNSSTYGTIPFADTDIGQCSARLPAIQVPEIAIDLILATTTTGE